MQPDQVRGDMPEISIVHDHTCLASAPPENRSNVRKTGAVPPLDLRASAVAEKISGRDFRPEFQARISGQNFMFVGRNAAPAFPLPAPPGPAPRRYRYR
jgi:hypothetical protein